MAEKTGDPVESLKWITNVMLRRIMPDHVIEEEDTPNLPDAKRAIVKMLESRNVWRTIKDCKSPKDMHWLLWRCTHCYARLKTDGCKAEPDLAGVLEAFGTFMVALGFIRGMQFGRELDTKTQGNVDSLLRHAAIRKLLLIEPKASTLKICQALDKVGEGVPWPKLQKEFGCWERAVSHQSVRTLITNSRKAALQDAAFQEFLSVASGAGDEGSITNQFRPKKYGLARVKKPK